MWSFTGFSARADYDTGHAPTHLMPRDCGKSQLGLNRVGALNSVQTELEWHESRATVGDVRTT